jgi:tripartite-type tricarboxylate transporter receptor subunit TctC
MLLSNVFKRAALALATVFLAPLAQAQDYPNKPVTLVVGYAAGGGVDFIARLLGEKLADRLKQP